MKNIHIGLYLGLFWWFSGKESAYSAGDTEEKGSIPGLGRSLEKGMATHSYSCLENPMDKGVWQGYSLWGHKELDMTEQLHF